MAEDRRINNVDVFRPTVQVAFHTTTGTFDIQTQTYEKIELDLLSCQTFKDLSQPAGMFVIHLADRMRWDKVIQPMDIVSIKMSNHISYNPNIKNYNLSEDNTHATMIGLVDSVKRKRLIDPASGKPQVFCEIRGRDFGKLFIKHQVRYLPWLLGAEGTERLTDAIKSMLRWMLSGLSTRGDISKLIRNALLRLFLSTVKIKFNVDNTNKNLSDLITYRFSTGMGYIPFSMSLQSQEGNLWQILSNFANKPWNEMWVDTVNAPKLVIPDSICAKEYSTPFGLTEPLLDKSGKQVRNSSTGRLETTTDTAKATNSRQQEWDELRKGYDPNNKTQVAKKNMLNERKTEFGIKDVDDPASQKVKVPSFIDGRLDNANIVLFARQTPFDNKRWQMLREFRCYNITNDDIQEMEVGTQDHEVFNYFWVYPTLAIPGEIPLKGLGIQPVMLSQTSQMGIALDSTDNLTPLSNPSVTPSAVEKYGFNPLELQTKVWRWSSTVAYENIKKVANRMLLAMVNWNKWNAHLTSGSMTIKGAPNLHVGDMLYNCDEDMEYYVEAVTNTYMQYQPMTTTVLVTRGQPRGDGKFDWGNVMQDVQNTIIKDDAQEGALNWKESKK